MTLAAGDVPVCSVGSVPKLNTEGAEGASGDELTVGDRTDEEHISEGVSSGTERLERSGVGRSKGNRVLNLSSWLAPSIAGWIIVLAASPSSPSFSVNSASLVSHIV